jgi:hypothetical protein
MTRSARVMCASFAAGLASGGASILVVFLVLHVHVARGNPHSTLSTWESLVLGIVGSSMVATMVAAAFNSHAARVTRAGVLSDEFFSAYRLFNSEAHDYLRLMESQLAGRPPAAKLASLYVDTRALGVRLPRANERRIALLEDVYGRLSGWPEGPAGLPDAATAIACADGARTQLIALEDSMRDLGGHRLRLFWTVSGKAA